MFLKIFIPVLVAAGSVAHACSILPDNAFGVCLNDNEAVDASIIETIGQEGVNYYKEVTSVGTSYSFRGSSNASIMVTVLAAFDSVTINDTVVSSSLLIVDTVVPNDWPNMVYITLDTSAVQLGNVAYGSCIRSELNLLVTAGILDLSRAEREGIEQVFSQLNTVGYYWTTLDSILANNAIIESDGEIHRYRCGIGEISVTLPPEALNFAADVMALPDRRGISPVRGAVDPSGSEMFFIDLNGRMLPGRRVSEWRSFCPGILFGYNRRTGVVKRILFQ
jgi:hypothetical protein